MNKRKDAYEKFAGDFKTEDEFEEEVEEEGLDLEEVEKEHFEESDESAIDEDNKVVRIK